MNLAFMHRDIQLQVLSEHANSFTGKVHRTANLISGCYDGFMKFFFLKKDGLRELKMF